MQRAKEIKERFLRSYEELRYVGLVNTKKEFAESIGITPSNLSRMKTVSGYEPNLSQIAALIDRYNISADWLLNGVGDLLKKQ